MTTETNEKYLAEGICWSVKGDWEFVKWLVDTKGLQPEAIRNSYTRSLYIAAARSYAKLAPSGSLPTTGDVVLELESHDSGVASNWERYINAMESPSIAMPKSAADNVMESYERDRVLWIVEGWLDHARYSDSPIRKSATELTERISDTLVGTEATGRPRNILEEAWSSGKLEPRSTGYSRLDHGIDGGWTPTYFYLIGMPSGHGKSSLACAFALRQAEMGHPVILNSFEMSSFSLLIRMICDSAGVTIDVAEDPYRKATPEEGRRIEASVDLLDKYVRIYDNMSDVPEINRRIRRHTIEYGESPLVIVDHLGIVRRTDSASEWSSIESMAYSFNDTAKTFKIPLVCFSQVPDGVEEELTEYNKVFHHKDYRGSKGLRNAIDYGMMGCRHNGRVVGNGGNIVTSLEYRNHTAIQLTKNRKTGRTFYGVFLYHPKHYRLTNQRGEGTSEDEIF